LSLFQAVVRQYPYHKLRYSSMPIVGYKARMTRIW
jgi:hypothetical protein